MALRVLVLPRIGDGVHTEAGRRMAEDAARFGMWGALLIPAAFALLFARQLAEFRDPFVPWTEDAALLLSGTDWGRTFHVSAALALAAPAAFALARARGAAGWVVAGVAVGALGIFPALTGHANSGEGLLRLSTLGADVLHVWAAGAWLGGLACLLWVDRCVRAGDAASPGPLPELVRAFSPVAVGSVAVLVATGMFASWVHVPGPAALFGSAYGRTLLFKVAAVGVVLALGALNWKKLTPRLDDTGGAEALRRSAALELLVAQVVLLATALLVRTPPGG